MRAAWGRPAGHEVSAGARRAGENPPRAKRWRIDDDVHVSNIDGVALIAYKVNEEMVIDGKTSEGD